MKELEKGIKVEPLSYLDKVQSCRFGLKIKYFESKSKRIDDLMKKLCECKERLKLIVESFKHFRSLKENESEKDYLFSLLDEEIFENQFGESKELKSLPSLYKIKDEALIILVRGELDKYKRGIFGSLKFEYRNWKCNALLKFCFGEKIKLEGVVACLKDLSFSSNKDLFLKEKSKDILKKIKNKKNDIEALIKEYDGEEEEYKKDKNAEKNYNDLKGLLDVIRANEKIDEINKSLGDMYKKKKK